MIDSSNFIFLPPWAKALSIIVLLVSLATSTYLIYHFVSKGGMSDHTLSALAVAQLSATGLVAAFILFFSEREMSSKLLRGKTDRFLEDDLLTSLSRITVRDGSGTKPVSASILDQEEGIDRFGRVFTLSSEQQDLRMWVGLNVHRFLVLYFLKLPDDKTLEQLEQDFMITFSGAKTVGYGVDYLSAEFPEENIACIRASYSVPEVAFLAKPTLKLYWANDIALMTQSLFRTALRNDIDTYTETMPHPI